MTASKTKKPPTKKSIAEAKREAKAVQRAADVEAANAKMSPQNRQHLATVLAAKNKTKSTAVALPKVTLSAEREQQLAEWNQKEAADKEILMDWGQRLQKTHKQVSNLNSQKYIRNERSLS